MKRIEDLVPGEYLRGAAGPRRIVRVLGQLPGLAGDRVELLFRDSDGELTTSRWDRSASVRTIADVEAGE